LSVIKYFNIIWISVLLFLNFTTSILYAVQVCVDCVYR